ncbi:MAG: hypothetical protein Q8R00_03265 [Candidatus Nanoarchaeia archaeon]|nr:hypothetical protein [Candidatus Nanoarchaeia archaeon]
MLQKNLLTLVIVILALGFVLNGGLTGQFYNSGAPSISDTRYAKGNVDHDPSGHIDQFDLKKLKNLISLRNYDKQGDLDNDGDLDMIDYALLEDFIASGQGSGYILPRSGVCTPDETYCGRNTYSGTGTVMICTINNYGVPEFVTEPCDKGSRCRNGQCEYRAAARLH